MLFQIAKKIFHQMPPEMAHHYGVRLIEKGLLPGQPKIEGARLHLKLAGLDLPNPVGLAAGFDKNAQTIQHIFAQGFGFAECGTVTPKPQAGNPPPRMFRLPEQEAVINRLGFNNAGLDEAVSRFERPHKGVVGANIGKNKDSADAVEDYLTCFNGLCPFADYITVNISSPNTQGLRDLQQGDALTELIDALHDARAKLGELKPIFVKIAPDLDEDQLKVIASIAMSRKLDGLIVSNTTIARPENLPEPFKQEVGGLSGRPLFAPSTEILRRMYQLTEATIPLIGVGGIASAENAYAKIRAGASAVQLYTALAYQGFGLVTEIKRGLIRFLERDGYQTISEAVGADSQ